MSNWVTSIAALGDYRAVIHEDLLVTTSGRLVTRTAILGKCEKMGGEVPLLLGASPSPTQLTAWASGARPAVLQSGGSFRSSIGFGR